MLPLLSLSINRMDLLQRDQEQQTVNPRSDRSLRDRQIRGLQGHPDDAHGQALAHEDHNRTHQISGQGSRNSTNQPPQQLITWGLKTTQIYKVPVPLVRSSNMGLKSSSLGCVYSGCSRGRPSSLFFPASRGCLLMALSSIFLSSSTTFLHHHISFSDTPVSLFHFKDQQ